MITEPTVSVAAPYVLSPRRISNLPEGERPRELLERDGAEQVGDRTLLAILLRSGVRGRSVVDLADALLDQYGTLTALGNASIEDLASIRGMGRVRAQVIKAALELAKRYARGADPAPVYVRTPDDVARVLRHAVKGREQESLWVFPLDVKYRLRRPPIEVTKGILDSCLVHPREVFREAIRSSSAAVILAHNHPSGDPTPSAEDIRITRQLVEAGRIMEIEVLDHIVIGRAMAGQERDYVSLRDSGLVRFGRA